MIKHNKKMMKAWKRGDMKAVEKELIRIVQKDLPPEIEKYKKALKTVI